MEKSDSNDMRKLLMTAVTVATMMGAAGCGGDGKEGAIDFETVSTEKTVGITAGQGAPQCKVQLQMAAAVESQGERAKAVNEAIAERLLDMEATSIRTAADSFANAYTESYRQNLAPLYREDQGDPQKRAWYEYHYNVTGETASGRRGVTVYKATVDYYEGGAHGVNQRIVMNFDNETGRLLTLADVFAPGYEQPLGELLLEKLLEKTDTKNVDELRERGFLYAMDMFPTENFVLGKDDITFIYNAYEIAPYDEGIIELTVDYGECKKILQRTD